MLKMNYTSHICKHLIRNVDISEIMLQAKAFLKLLIEVMPLSVRNIRVRRIGTKVIGSFECRKHPHIKWIRLGRHGRIGCQIRNQQISKWHIWTRRDAPYKTTVVSQSYQRACIGLLISGVKLALEGVFQVTHNRAKNRGLMP